MQAIDPPVSELAQELAPIGIKVTAVAPGAFRTDFLSSHSIRKSDAGSDAYAASVGKMAQVFDTTHGKQIGDPVRGAAALLALVDAAAPPVQLLLGSDAFQRARRKLDATIEEIEQWESVTIGTDFPSGT